MNLFSTVWQWLRQTYHRWASPKYFYRYAGKAQPWCWLAFTVLAAYGLVGGLLLAPADYQQGDGFRIIYVHVPSAFLSLMVYTSMAVAAIIGLVWQMKLAHAYVRQAAPLGALFTFFALVTGSLWGKPMWGTWWIWDARLTSELILLFLYLGVMALQSAIPNPRTADRAGALLVIVGVVNIPIIHYSVKWWNTLHQGTTVNFFGGQSHMATAMLYPLLCMMGAFIFYFAAVMFMRLRLEVLKNEAGSGWVKSLLEGER